MREFGTGATRDDELGKLDFEGALSPLVIKRFTEYMSKHRIQKDGTLRDSDNWQALFGEDHLNVCMKSLSRHYMDLWLIHRGHSAEARESKIDALAGVIFNAMAYWYALELAENKLDKEEDIPYIEERDSENLDRREINAITDEILSV